MKKLLVLLLLFLLSCGPSEEEIQERINQAVEEATSTSTTTTTLAPITTTSTSTSATSTSTSTSTTSTSTSTSTTSTSTSTTSTSTSTSTTSTTTTTVYVDNEPPTWPDKTITIVNLNPTYFEVQWKPASDNTNVAGYRFYLDNIFKGEYIRNNDNNSIFLDGLTQGTTYNLEIIAYDDDSNLSIDNPTLTITTTIPTTTSTTTTTLLTVLDSGFEYFVDYTAVLGATSNITVNITCPPIFPPSDPKEELVGDPYPVIKDQTPQGFVDYNTPTSWDYSSDGFDLVSVSLNGDTVVAIFTPISQEIFDSKGGSGEVWHRWLIYYTCEFMVRTYP